MAYNYVIPQTYSPNYFQQQYAIQQSQQIPQVQQNPQTSSGLIWIQGEQAAKSFLVAPNSTVLLMDSETNRFYIKSADNSGMPLPIRVFEYREIKANNAIESHEKDGGIDMGKYVTKDELDRKLAELRGDKDNG